jgi:hypothetical protein
MEKPNFAVSTAHLLIELDPFKSSRITPQTRKEVLANLGFAKILDNQLLPLFPQLRQPLSVGLQLSSLVVRVVSTTPISGMSAPSATPSRGAIRFQSTPPSLYTGLARFYDHPGSY